MTDPRDIRMADIDWQTILHDMGRSARPLWRLVHVDPNRAPKPYHDGSWHDLTLGQVADKGERDILRHLDVGPKALQRLREIIDMARAGTLPLKGSPAPDSLWPRDREENGRFSGGSGDYHSDLYDAERARAEAAEAKAHSWQTAAEANGAAARIYVERCAEAERIITDLIGSTGVPWAEAVGRAESFLYAKNEKGKAND